MDEKKYSINEILAIIDNVYFNELGPIPGADIHDFYRALTCEFIEFPDPDCKNCDDYDIKSGRCKYLERINNDN